MPANHQTEPPRVATGIAGLDDILAGGLIRNRVYLLQGDPGTGKTTLGMQFLLEGARRGEPGLCVTLSETESELRASAQSHGWPLEGIRVLELIVSEESLQPDSQYTMFHPSEVELGEQTRAVMAEVDRTRPARIVFDPLSEMRLLSPDPLRYRRQILALKKFFTARGATVLFLDDRTANGDSRHVQSLVHGEIVLEQVAPVYGVERRRLRVVKVRGAQYRGGYHDFTIRRGGISVFPRLVTAEHHAEYPRNGVKSGIGELDAMLGGGLERGTSTLLIGPSGVGKSTLVAQYVAAAAARGERGAVFTFDERREILLARADALGIGLGAHVHEGRVHLRQIDPAELSPGEFAHAVLHEVEANDAEIVVIDTLNGYLSAMPEDRFLLLHLHELLMSLAQRGTVAFLIMPQHGFLGDVQTSIDVSYMSDAILLLRYFEARGEIRKAISAVKKRSGGHEQTIREFRLEPAGIRIGEPLREFHGVLSEAPTYHGPIEPLLQDRDHEQQPQ